MFSSQTSQELKRRISVRERTQHWEARGSDLPSFFTLPKSFRSKGGNGGVTQPPGGCGCGGGGVGGGGCVWMCL